MATKADLEVMCEDLRRQLEEARRQIKTNPNVLGAAANVPQEQGWIKMMLDSQREMMQRQIDAQKEQMQQLIAGLTETEETGDDGMVSSSMSARRPVLEPQ